ncbi:branched-chain amino acid ABC transporter substrate-binding protein [Methylobacterium planeticum]|uniref:Branched-chain amino acid ABC transporter substrate-binding protein n=1 Tax=Methylobacterium planeticum TaxID=2615211 RepID=A0A6N6MUF9_9HYPH|nr:branched-chain amino acid ABC transporter substrate-binding protein [Methylobacterium planeticum]KAB1075300.1 branched-chain amino acid ABC transporter substrate-binding protein [Methylobacterium planeticum]
MTSWPLLLALLLLPHGAWAQASAPLRIGLSAPLTGPDAAFGQGLRLGAEQAVAEINRAGGAGGRKLVLAVGDDASDARQGVALARRFAAEGISLVVGPLSSAVTAQAAPVYEEAGIVVVTPGATWPPLTGRGQWNLFRTVASDAQQGALAGAYLADRYGSGRIALVHDRSSFGRGLADEVARKLKARGHREAVFESLPRGARDASDLVAKLKAARVDAVYFGGLAPEGALLVRSLREAGLDAPVIASDGILDRDFAANAGPGGDGTLMTVTPEPHRLPDPKGARPAPRSPEADAVAAEAYAAVEILAQGIARARTGDGRKVAAALHAGGPFRTVVGEIGFDGRGDPSPSDVTLRVWRRTPDGRLDYAGNEVAP